MRRPSSARSAARTACLRSRRIRGYAAGAPRSSRSWRMRRSTISTGHRCGSRRRTSRFRRPTSWKTSRCPRSIASSSACAARCKRELVSCPAPIASRLTSHEAAPMSSRYDNLLANVPTDLWIGGKWRKSSDGGRFDVLDPATESKIASVASATVDDAKAAVDAASAAFEGWAGRKPRERAEVLRKSFELIMRDAERLAKLITIENGKALSDSRRQVASAPQFFRWYTRDAAPARGAAHGGAAHARGRPRAGAAVEFPRRHGDAQDRPRARGRLHGGAQACLRYAAHHAGADADPGGGRRAGRRGQRHSLALV